MSGRKTNITAQETALGSHNHHSIRCPDSLELVRTGRDMVDSSAHWLGHFRCDARTANLAKRALVSGVNNVNKKKRNIQSNKKAGRPASSSNVRLTPHFNNPIDVEQLGKALVAVALKKTVRLDAGGNDSDSKRDSDSSNNSGGNHAET